MQDERLKILKMLQTGQIGAEQAALLLSALKEAETPAPAEAPAPEVLPPTPRAPERRQERWAKFWIYPLLAGGAVLIVGSVIMGLTYATGAATGWRVCCGWLPLLFGSMVILLAWWSRRAKWLHLRVKQPRGRTIAFSLPLPLTLAACLLRIAQPFVPQLKDAGVDHLIIALRDHPHGEPLSLDVEDGEDGEHVQISIG